MSNPKPEQLWLIFAAALIMILALVGVASVSPRFMLNQVFNYYLNYNDGYVNRGLLGTLIKAFFGVVPLDVMAEKTTAVESVLRFINLFLLTALLIPPILLSRFSTLTKWTLLMSAAAVLTAPVWKLTSLEATFMDKWIFLFALLSVASFVFRRPFLFCVFSILAILTHPAGVFFYFPMACMALHAVFRFDISRPRLWIFAALFPLVVFIAGGIFNNPEAAVASLQNIQFPGHWDKRFEQYVTHHHGASIATVLFTGWTLFPKNLFLLILFFGVPPLFIALILIVVLPPSKAVETLKFEKRGVKERITQFLIDGRWLFLLAATPMAVFPFSGDYSRHLYWIWWVLALALVYYVWFFNPQSVQAKNRKKQKNPRQSPLRLAPPFIIAFIAFTQSGMPTVGAHLQTAAQLSHGSLSDIGVHTWGRYVAFHIIKKLNAAPFPIHANASQLFKARWIEPSDVELIKLEDDTLILSDGYQDDFLWEHQWLNRFIFTEPHIFTFTLRHDNAEAAKTNPIFLINKTPLKAESVDNEKIVWRGTIPKPGQYLFGLQFDNKGDFRIKGIDMELQ